MLVHEINACSFDKWYPLFEKVTFKSRIIQVPEEVLNYLRSDESLVLPEECVEQPRLHDNADSDTDSNAEDVTSWSDEDEQSAQQPSFPEFHQLIVEAIDDLGGNVFPKLNWSSPRDASWMGFGNSLKCSSPAEVWLLLKSSDFVAHDLTQPYKDTEDVLTVKDFQEPQYVLVLREWKDINSGFEFRCFVKSGKLIGITQRDQTHFYDYIRNDEESIVSDILRFFVNNIASKFLLENFVFDVVRFKKSTLRLVDFNPFGQTTDSILFEWSELLQIDSKSSTVQFRFVQSDSGIQPSLIRHYSLPRDIVEIADGTDHEKMVDFLKLQSSMQNEKD